MRQHPAGEACAPGQDMYQQVSTTASYLLLSVAGQHCAPSMAWLGPLVVAECKGHVSNLNGLFPVVLHQQNMALRISPAQITPSVDSAMFFFGTNALHFSEEFYGTVLLIDGIAQVMGVSTSSKLSPICSNCLMLKSICNVQSLNGRKA